MDDKDKEFQIERLTSNGTDQWYVYTIHQDIEATSVLETVSMVFLLSFIRLQSDTCY